MTVYGFILGGLIISALTLPLAVYVHVGVRRRWSLVAVIANCVLVYSFSVLYFDTYPKDGMDAFLACIVLVAVPLAIFGRRAVRTSE